MISYYLLTTVVDALTAVNEDDWQIAADIKDGNISQFLLKPIDYLWYRLCLFLSGRLTYLAVAAMPLTLFILCLRQYFVLPPNWADVRLLPALDGADGAAAVLHVLRDGDAGVLGAGSLDVHLHPVSPSNTSPAATCSRWTSCRRGLEQALYFTPVSLPALFSR